MLKIYLLVWLAIYSVKQIRGQCTDDANIPLNITVTGYPLYVTTPNYPSSYSADDDCEWLIVANDPSQRILANIQDVYTESCRYDYGKLFDGSDTNAPELAKFCSDNVDEFISTGHTFYLTFTSDYAVQYKGFNILLLVSNDDLQRSCDSVLPNATSTEQYVMSENIPDLYQANYSCSYTIYPSTQYYAINITMYFMDIESSTACANDKFSISGSVNGVLNEQYSACSRADTHEHTIPEITGDYIVVTFTTNEADEFYGYYFSYAEVFNGMNITYPTTIDDVTAAVQVTVDEGNFLGSVDTTVAYIAVTHEGTMTYNITDDAGADVPFTLQQFSSKPDAVYRIRHTARIDAENGDTLEYMVLIRLTDSNIPQLTSSVYFNITFQGTDDESPSITLNDSNPTIYRTRDAGYNVTTVTVTDADVGTGSQNNLTMGSGDTYNLLNFDNVTGQISLAQNMDVLPLTVTSYTVTFIAEGIERSSTATLTITVPPDSPPECTHDEISTEPLDATVDGPDTYVDYMEEWSCTDDNTVITYSIGSVTPTLTTPLFDIESDTGEVFITRSFSQGEAGSDRKFIVVVMATDSLPQVTNITQIINVTAFNCYPNPQNVYVRMDFGPGTVVTTDFNCSTNINLEMFITRQYPSNTFEIQNVINESYALILREQVYQIRFYSLYITITDGVDYVPVKFNPVIQTVFCDPSDVS